MRVALSVDAIEPQLTGIGRYTLELARGLARSPEISTLQFFRGREAIEDPEALLVDAGDTRRPNRFARWRAKRRHAHRIAGMRSSIVHAPNFFLPDWADGGVATIHDLSVLRFPETHPQARLDDYEKRFARTLERADHFITGTQAMRAELSSTLAIDPGRISVVPHGVRRPQQVDSNSLVRHLADKGLEVGRYTLCVATIEPRKQIVQLIDAYRQLPPHIRALYPLVLVGKLGWRADDIVKHIRQAEAERWLKWLGYATDEQLHSLFFGARLFVYPSLYEGFGLPPLEAMAHHVPALISDDPSMVEVSGGAAMIFPVNDPSAFARAIVRGLEDEDWRKSAIDLGDRIVERLSWQFTVDRTIAVYRKLC